MVQTGGFGIGAMLAHGFEQQDLATSLWSQGSRMQWLAQASGDNLLNNFEGAFNHFVQSGQVWALIIGLILGYLLRSLTAY